MAKKINLTGMKFGRLTVLYDTGERRHGLVVWSCKCSCGNLTPVVSMSLKSGDTRSCGCLAKETATRRLREIHIRQKGSDNPQYIHGECSKKTRLYQCWTNMKSRCFNSKTWGYTWYGKKGIVVCPEWKNSYIVFRQWAVNNGYKDNLTIDRIDGRGNYEPSNCRWITRVENCKRPKIKDKPCTLHEDMSNGKYEEER